MILIGYEAMSFKSQNGQEVSGTMCYFADKVDSKRGAGIKPVQRKTSTGAVKNWFFSVDRIKELNFRFEVNQNYNLTFDYTGAIVGIVKA